MLCNLKLRIKTPIVGNTWDHKRTMFVFPREDGAWCLDIKNKHAWNGLLENAVSSLSMDVDTDTIRWPRTLLLPSIHLLEVFSAPEKKQKPVRHESIPRNVILTIPVMIRHTDGEQGLRYPSEKQLYDIFKFIGAYEGISPFGSSAGYGLFDVQGVHTVGRTAVDIGELSNIDYQRADIHNQEAGN